MKRTRTAERPAQAPDLTEHVRRIVADAPPLTDQQRRRLADLLRGGDAHADAA